MLSRTNARLVHFRQRYRIFAKGQLVELLLRSVVTQAFYPPANSLCVYRQHQDRRPSSGCAMVRTTRLS